MPDVLEWKRNIEVLREIIKKQTLRFGIKSSGYANSIILLLFLLACIRLSIIVLLYFVYDYFEIPT